MSTYPHFSGAPTDACVEFAPLLPLLRGGDLTPEQEARVLEHLATCAWCRGELAAYDVLDGGLRRMFAAPPVTMEPISEDDLFEALARSNAADLEEQSRPLLLPAERPLFASAERPRQARRRLPPLLGALAAILLLTVGFSVLFHARGGSSIATSPTHTAAASPSPSLNIPGPEFNFYVAGTDGAIYALRSTDLAVRWRAAPSGSVQGMARDAQALYVVQTGASGDQLLARSLTDGTTRWMKNLTRPFASKASLVATGSEIIYADAVDLYALRASDGAELWRHALPGAGPITFAQGMILAYASETSILYALRASDGSQVWSRMVASLDAASVSSTAYYGLTSDGVLYAFALRDGQQLWSFAADGGSAAFNGIAPTVAGATLYLLTTTYLYALGADGGTVIWRDGVDLPPTYAPVAVGERVFLAGHGHFSSSFLYAVSASDGSKLWENHDNYGWVASPIAAGNTIWAVGSPEIAVLHAETGAVFAATTLPSEPLLGMPILTSS